MDRRRYAVPAILGVLAVLLIVVGSVLNIVQRVDPQLRQLATGATVRSGTDGFAIYSDSAEDVDISCSYTNASDSSEVAVLNRAGGGPTVDYQGRTYTQIARSPATLAAGTYRVSCGSARGDLSYGAREVSGGTGGILISVGALVAVFALIGFFYVRRRGGSGTGSPGVPGRDPGDVRRSAKIPPHMPHDGHMWGP